MTEPKVDNSRQPEQSPDRQRDEYKAVKLIVGTLSKDQGPKETAKRSLIAGPDKSEFRPVSAEDLDRIAQRIGAARAVFERHFGSTTWSSTVRDLSAFQKLLDGNLVLPGDEQTLRDIGLAFGQVLVANDPRCHWVRLNDMEAGIYYAIQYADKPIWQHPEHMILKRVEVGEAVDLMYLLDGARASVKYAVKRFNRPRDPFRRAIWNLIDAASSLITRVRFAR
mgnify:CR=1 FL=1